MGSVCSLAKREDFKKVYENGKSGANRLLVMYTLKREDDEESRIGISVSKKVGNSIVRHRLKRLIKESYRLNKEKFDCGYDVVIIARTTAKGKSYAEIESALLHIAKVQRLWDREK